MRRRGASLAEILVVMVLIGLLTAIAAPRLKASTRATVEQCARLFAQDLDGARTKAYATRARVRVVRTDSTYNLFLDSNRDSLFSQNAAEQLAYGAMSTRKLETKIRFSRGLASVLPTDAAGGAMPTKLQFATSGVTEPFGTSAVFYFSHIADTRSVYAVEVSAGANVRLWRWVNNTWQ